MCANLLFINIYTDIIKVNIEPASWYLMLAGMIELKM